MKKTAPCLWLALLILILSAACTASARFFEAVPVNLSLPDAAAPALIPATGDPQAAFSYNATVEYGDPDAILAGTGPLWTYIQYPQAGGFADKIVAHWAQTLYANARRDIDALCQPGASAAGKIHVLFDSYLVDGRFVGIVERGTFAGSHWEQPRNIVGTFNLDIERGILLSRAELLDPAHMDAVLALLREKIIEARPDAADSLDEPDVQWLSHVAIGHDGLLVLLERGLYLPPSLGSLTLTLPYTELGDAFLPFAERDSANPSAPDIPFQSAEISPDKPVVALTFDDGPSRYTDPILDLLERHGARATFCVIGNLVEARRDTVARAFDLGCEIVGHSWAHRDLTKLTAEQILTELLDTNLVISSITGTAPKFHRPPYGAVSKKLTNASREADMAMLFWSVDPQDWRTQDADTVAANILEHVKDGSVIICHDLYASTVEAMERVIPELISQGYQFVTVSELFAFSDEEVEAGAVYRGTR